MQVHIAIKRSTALELWTIKKIYGTDKKRNFPLFEEHMVTKKKWEEEMFLGLRKTARSLRCSFFTKIWRKSTGPI